MHYYGGAKQKHGVAINGEDTYLKKVVFYLSELKPEAEMVSEASRGRYDFNKPENITDLYRQSHRTNWKHSVIRRYQKPLEAGLKLKIQLLAEFCHPPCDMKFVDPRQKFESLCYKPTTQRNLKHKAPSVRALTKRLDITNYWHPWLGLQKTDTAVLLLIMIMALKLWGLLTTTRLVKHWAEAQTKQWQYLSFENVKQR